MLIAGSHTHHGPVIELIDEPDRGRGKFPAAVAYSSRLADRLIETILAADRAAQPARLGVATKALDYNRNRQTKHLPKPTEPNLAVLRFDDLDGQPLAVLVNFAAHPTMVSGQVLKFSADYPGALRARVEAELGAPCIFMPGAAGDMSPNPPAANRRLENHYLTENYSRRKIANGESGSPHPRTWRSATRSATERWSWRERSKPKCRRA